MAFHEQKRLGAIRNSTDRVKAIDGTSYRMTHSPYIRGIPYTSTGSKVVLQFVNPDQSDKILERHITGGVMNKNRGAVQQMLSRRAEDIINMKLAQENLPPMEGPIESLSEEDSLKLELSKLLSEAQAFGTTSGRPDSKKAFTENMYKVSRILIRLFPVLSDGDVSEILDNIENLIAFSEVEREEADDDEDYVIYDNLYIINMTIKDMLENLLENINLSEQDKKLLSKTWLKKLMKPFKGIDSVMEYEKKVSAPSVLQPELQEVPIPAPDKPEEGEDDIQNFKDYFKGNFDNYSEDDLVKVWRGVFGKYAKTLNKTSWEKTIQRANVSQIDLVIEILGV